MPRLILFKALSSCSLRERPVGSRDEITHKPIQPAPRAAVTQVTADTLGASFVRTLVTRLCFAQFLSQELLGQPTPYCDFLTEESPPLSQGRCL